MKKKEDLSYDDIEIPIIIFSKIILFILYKKKNISFLCSLYIFPFLTLFHVWSRIILETRDFKRSFPFVRLTNWFDVANNCSWFDRLIKKQGKPVEKKNFFFTLFENRDLQFVQKVYTRLRRFQQLCVPRNLEISCKLG